MTEDMFPDELLSGLNKEIIQLKNVIEGLRHDCRHLNMIYKSAWDIAAIVCGDGSHTLETDEELFVRLYDRMQGYDDNQDLRDKYPEIFAD